MDIQTQVIEAVIASIILIVAARLLGKLCTKFQIPELVGYVTAGLILGPFAFGQFLWLYDRPMINLDGLLPIFSQIAAIVILFSAGLHFTFKDLRKIGLKAGIISGIEFLFTVFVSYNIAIMMGLESSVSLIIATTFGATSIAVSVVVLEQIKKENEQEAKLLINIAVLDDILGLALLSAATGLILNQQPIDIGFLGISVGEAILFWILLVVVAVIFLPRIMKISGIKGSITTTDVAATGSAFGFASIASLLGLNPIVGAFAAGMGLAGSHLNKHVREFIDSIKMIFTPLFFAVIGANVNWNHVENISITLFLVLLAIAVGTKFFGASVPSSILLRNKKSGIKIGFGMISRSEVAFITAGIGLSTGIINNEIYSTLTFVILSTVFIGPLMLRWSYSK